MFSFREHQDSKRTTQEQSRKEFIEKRVFVCYKCVVLLDPNFSKCLREFNHKELNDIYQYAVRVIRYKFTGYLSRLRPVRDIETVLFFPNQAARQSEKSRPFKQKPVSFDEKHKALNDGICSREMRFGDVDQC